MQLDLLVKTWPKALGNGKGIFMLVLVHVFRGGAGDCISLCTTPQLRCKLKCSATNENQVIFSQSKSQNISSRYTRASLTMLHTYYREQTNFQCASFLSIFSFPYFFTYIKVAERALQKKPKGTKKKRTEISSSEKKI